MFKARNVIEAGVLAFAIGVPVFSLLPLGLTARIIALCLTALPAALVALIGISGESLSSFLLIFLKYLRNRRIVGGNSAEDAVPAAEHGGKHIKKKAHKPDKTPRRSRRSGREDFPAEFDEVRSYDKGAAGIEASMAHWAAMPDDVVTMGFYNLETYDNYAYQTVNGITFGYLSYTEHTNGLPTPSGTDYGVVYLDDHETIAKQIADMRPNCDVLIVSAHMGTEGTHEVNDFQRETAQWLADQGVDVIIGTHPHVVQNAAWLTGANGNTTFIVYSLGNFINAQSSRDNVIGAILDVYFDKTTQPDGSVSIAIRDPKLHCVISQYEAGYKNIRVIPYSQYTDELGAAHGEFTLSREYIESMLRSTIDEEFFTLD